MESIKNNSDMIMENSTAKYWKEKYLNSLEEKLSHAGTIQSGAQLMSSAPGPLSQNGANKLQNLSTHSIEHPLEFTMIQESSIEDPPASMISVAAENDFTPTDSPLTRMSIKSVLSAAAAMGDVPMDVIHQPLQITIPNHHYNDRSSSSPSLATPPPSVVTPQSAHFPSQYYNNQYHIGFNNGNSNSNRPAPPPIPVMQMTTRTTPVQRPIIPHPDHEKWIAWTDIVRQRFPDWSGSTPAMSNYAKAFLKEHRLPETRVSPLTGITSKPTLGILKDLQKTFMDGFDKRFRTTNGEWVQERRKGVIINLHPLGNTRDDGLESPSSPTSYNPILQKPNKSEKLRHFPHFIQTHNLPGQRPRSANPSPIKRSNSQSSFISNSSSASMMSLSSAPSMTRMGSSDPVGDFILSSTETTEQRGRHLIKLWTDVVRGKHESFLLDNVRNLSLQTRVRNGVKEFLTKRAPSLQLSLESCILTSERGKASYGIPEILIPSFLNWFEEEGKTQFQKYSDGTLVSDFFRLDELAQSPTNLSSFENKSSNSLPALSTSSATATCTNLSSSRKRVINGGASSFHSATPRLDSEDFAAMEAFALLSPDSDMEYSTPYSASKRARLTMDQSYDLYMAASQVADDVMDSPPASAGSAPSSAGMNRGLEGFKHRTRYTALVKRLIPTYKDLPKQTRISIKKSTKQFLLDQLGNNTDRLNECIAWPKRGIFQTYSIPHALYNSYYEWIKVNFGPYCFYDGTLDESVETSSVGTQTNDSHAANVANKQQVVDAGFVSQKKGLVVDLDVVPLLEDLMVGELPATSQIA